MMAGFRIRRKILNQVPLYSMNLLAGDQMFTVNEKADNRVV